MKLFAGIESRTGETRAALTPDAVKKLVGLGAAVAVESGLGETAGFADSAYEAAGAVLAGAEAALPDADMVVTLNPIGVDRVGLLKRGAISIGFMEALQARDRVTALADAGVTGIAMELIPRTTIAQKMDALSSQANLGGYVSVILGASHLDRILPMMMTPAGTLTPARVFVIGAGVAGLQAIATAKRLGARVEAFDTRPVVEEQVASLGAKFIKVDLGETGQSAGGYARQLTPEQLALQRQAMARHCAQSDIVITTAQVFGRKAPEIVTEEMVQGMRPGSVVVDMAVESGGNVRCSRLDEAVNVNGVQVLGYANLPGRVPAHASQMYAANVANLIDHFWDREASALRLDLEDEILDGCVVTHDGVVRSARVREALGLEG